MKLTQANEPWLDTVPADWKGSRIRNAAQLSPSYSDGPPKNDEVCTVVPKAALILAAIEFIRRRIKPEGVKIRTPADLLPHVRHYADRKQEHFLCASINGANEILNIRVVSIGLIDRTPVHPREVFADVLSDRASAIIVAHNHPTGDLEPSESDVDVTNQLKAAGSVVGITLMDHIIFNRSGYFSFLEAGRL